MKNVVKENNKYYAVIYNNDDIFAPRKEKVQLNSQNHVDAENEYKKLVNAEDKVFCKNCGTLNEPHTYCWFCN